jgi:hypothetical protein
MTHNSPITSNHYYGKVNMSVRTDRNAEETGVPSSVLLLTSAADDCAATACRELSERTPSEQSHVILATGLQSPRERLDDWDDQVGVRPAETTVVDVATATRSAAASAGGAPDPLDGAAGPGGWADATVERVPKGDLLGLGETLDTALSRSDRPTTLCMRSVSDLLQSADLETVFRFLEVLTRNVERAGGVAHYHLTTDVHDPEAVETLEVLFDAVLDLREDTPADR